MVDAILLGQLHLDIDVHESLINATMPYNWTYRIENNILSEWDHVFFEGKYYSYFGIVPALILFVPYFLIFGKYLSATVATFIFATFGAIGVYLLWKELVKKYIKSIPYTLYLASLVCVLFGTNLMLLTVRAHIYEAAISSGFMFSVWGLFFLLKSVSCNCLDKINHKFLFFGGVCLALAVGCRPTMLIYSLLAPFILWPVLKAHLPLNKLASDRQACKTVAISLVTLAIPYIIIGFGLMWYNYARFGSISEFGTSYMITVENLAVRTDVGILGNLQRMYEGLHLVIFRLPTMNRYFPFFTTDTVGFLAFPVSLFLFTIFYNRDKNAFPLVLAMIVVSMIIILFSAMFVGAGGRYTVDYFWLLTLSSLLCIGLIYENAYKIGDKVAVAVRRVGFVAIWISCFIFFNWGMVGENNYIFLHNPRIFRYIVDLFTIT